MGIDSRLRHAAEAADVPRDAVGRPLTEGDGVVVAFRTPVVFRVAQITPVIDPSAPANLVHLHLVAAFPVTVAKGRPVAELLRVGTVADLGPLPFSLLEAAPSTETTQ